MTFGIESVSSRRLEWDKSGERYFQTGVDRGVLYLHDGTVAAWNGLTSVEESSNTELKSYYLDNVKYLDTVNPGDFSGVLKAFTYPDEFDKVNGIAEPAPGLFYHDQPPKSFNLSYRVRKGNDLEGMEHGYVIHILYNIVATPDSQTFETLQDSPTPTEFSWGLSGTPQKVTGYRPMVHISIDSNATDAAVLEAIENILYGTDSSSPSLPSINDIVGIFGFYGSLIIVDNGDGTWTAIDEADNYITMINPTTFQIDNANVVIIDASTYEISTTNP